MSSKYGRNFTNFQNVGLTGSSTSEPVGVGMFEMGEGLTNAASTVSISMIGSGTAGSENSANMHPYFHISNAGLSIGTGFIRLTALGAAPYGTIRASAAFQEDAAWRLPALSGIVGVFGTIGVGLESIGANATYSTTILLTAAGAPVDRPDMTCIFGMSRLNGTSTTRGFPVIIGNTPTNSGVELFFINPSGTATAAGQWEMNFICAR
mgnify:CR=1 FL=1